MNTNFDKTEEHKLVVDIATTGLRILDKESEDYETEVIMEWLGNSRESVLAQAKAYLSNNENYSIDSLPEDRENFVKNFVNVGLDHIESGKANFWSSKEELDVTFTYLPIE